MSVDATIRFALSVVETLDSDDFPFAATESPLIHNGLDANYNINADSTPVASLMAGDSFTLTGGTDTIDLTAAAHNGTTVDASGLKTQSVILRNPSTNSGSIQVSEGASNGYELLGNAFTFSIPVGGHILMYLPEGTPDVAGGAKNVDVVGTAADDLEVIFVFG